MYDKIPTILTAQEILDKAFKKAEKIGYKGKRDDSLNRINSFSDTVSHTLRRYVKKFPSIDDLIPFYRELIDIEVGRDALKKSLSNIQWASNKAVSIARREKERMNENNHGFIRKKVYGRISSVVKKIDGDLKVLSRARAILRNLPEMREDAVNVVMAGYPNVGKSSIIRALSTAEPEIAVYPFTTKQIIVGHRVEKTGAFQFIDTPGLLDRASEKSNEIERKAMAALSYATDILVFVIDPSETCGYEVEKQEKLMEHIKEKFSAPAIIVEAKSDIIKRKTGNLKVSVVTGEGMEELMDRIRETAGTLRTLSGSSDPEVLR